jgi:26S proteasome regulatory subunit N4
MAYDDIVRMTRARIIHLRNDYKSVMNKLEVAVQEQFAAMAQNPQNAAPFANLTSRPATGSTAESDVPFAAVDEIASQGPAEAAGLKIGDKIVRFGSVNWLNHDRLRKVGEVVNENEGVSIMI